MVTKPPGQTSLPQTVLFNTENALRSVNKENKNNKIKNKLSLMLRAALLSSCIISYMVSDSAK